MPSAFHGLDMDGFCCAMYNQCAMDCHHESDSLYTSYNKTHMRIKSEEKQFLGFEILL